MLFIYHLYRIFCNCLVNSCLFSSFIQSRVTYSSTSWMCYRDAGPISMWLCGLSMMKNIGISEQTHANIEFNAR